MFSKTRREEGPFYAAGYTDFYLEGRDSAGLTPDLFGFDDDWLVVADITASPHKGPDDAMKYSDSRLPDAVEQLIAPSTARRELGGAPFVLTNVDPTDAARAANVVVTRHPVKVDLHDVKHEKLKERLSVWKGFSTTPPSFGFSALPESERDEVRGPLIGALKWAATQDGPVPVDELVQRLLGQLYESVSMNGRARLRNTILDLLADLTSKESKKKGAQKSLTYDPVKKVVEVPKDYFRSARRPAFTRSLLAWTGKDPSQVRLQRHDEEE